MASVTNFIRNTPLASLRDYFTAAGIEFPTCRATPALQNVFRAFYGSWATSDCPGAVPVSQSGMRDG